MERSTKIKDMVKPTCLWLFGIPEYHGTGQCISQDEKCTNCWVYKRILSSNSQKDPQNLKKESISKPPEK